MPKKHRHAKPRTARAEKPSHTAADHSPPPEKPIPALPPAAYQAIGVLIIALGLMMGVGGFRFVYSQHHAALAQRALRTENNLTETESNALKAIRLFPSNGFAHHMAGAVYRIQGRHVEALEHYRQALRTTAHPGTTLHGMGECVLHGANVPADQGVAWFERGLRLWPRPQPEPAYVWYEAGALAVNNDMPAAAILFMTRSQNLLQEQEYDIALAKAEAYDSLGLTSVAAVYLARQLVIDPNFATASNYTLTMCRNSGAFDDGRFTLGVALAIHPDSANLHNAATGLEFMAGDLDKAAVHARRALEINPKMVSPHYFLGEIHFQRNQWEDAKVHVEAYLNASGPDDPQVARLKNRLEEINRRLTP